MSEYRRLYEPAGVYSHTSATVSGGMTLLTRRPHTEVQTVYPRLTSRRISSSSTSPYWLNITTIGNPLRQLHLTSERAQGHLVQGFPKIEVITGAYPLPLRTSPPPQRSQQLIKKSQARVRFTGFPGEALMISQNQFFHLLK